MTVRRALVGRWSRRDGLAVVAVAVATALLTGVVVLGTAVSSGGAAMAAEYHATTTASWHESVPVVRTEVPGDGVVVPVARATTGSGVEVVVAGVPDGATLRNRTGVALPRSPDAGATLGRAPESRPVRQSDRVRLSGRSGAVTLSVDSRGRSALPPSWYVTSPSTVEQLGADGALVLAPTDETVPGSGAAVPGALGFLVAGGRQVAGGLGVVGAVTAVIVVVTVHGTTRATVVDRRRTLAVLRATGGTPRRIVALFAARAAALTAAGVALGYAGGVVAVHAAESVAAAAGVPTALAVGVGPRAAALLAVTYVAVCGLGAAAGALAARSARRPPGRLFGEPATTAGGLPTFDVRLLTPNVRLPTPDVGQSTPGEALAARVRPRLLDYRAVLPTAAGVAASTAVVLLVLAGLSVAGPAVTGTGAVVTEPSAAHPIASTVPAGYATALRDGGTPASGEVLVLATVDGNPVLVRGARFDAFATVSGARLRSGRRPRTPSEAVVGVDLARTLGVEVGDALALGGTGRAGAGRVTVARVRVVGTYAGPGATDDQVVVPLATGRHLAGKPPGTVQFVRTGRLSPGSADEGSTGTDGPVVVGVSAPARAVSGDAVAASVTLVNAAPSARTGTVEVTLGEANTTRSVDLPGGARRTITVTLSAGSPGERVLRAGPARTSVRVLAPGAIRLRGLPARAPPRSAPRVTVVDARGEPVPGATVAAGSRTRRTGPDGRVRVPLGGPGTTTVVVRTSNDTVERSVRVSRDVERTLAASVRVEPSRPSPLTRPVAVVRLTNPWNGTLVRTVTVHGPVTDTDRTVRLVAGERRTLRVPLDRRPPGEHRVTVRAEDQELANASVVVAAGDRLVAAASTRTRRGGVVGVGLETALSAAVGDLRLLAGVVLALAGLAALGVTLSTFAATVRARRTALGVRRATGATRRQLLLAVVADALRVGTPASVAGVAAGVGAVRLLGSAGVLVVYGVSLQPRPSPLVVGCLVVAGVLVAVLGAVGAAAALLSARPAALLDGSAVPPPGGDGRD